MLTIIMMFKVTLLMIVKMMQLLLKIMVKMTTHGDADKPAADTASPGPALDGGRDLGRGTAPGNTRPGEQGQLDFITSQYN